MSDFWRGCGAWPCNGLVGWGVGLGSGYSWVGFRFSPIILIITTITILSGSMQ